MARTVCGDEGFPKPKGNSSRICSRPHPCRPLHSPAHDNRQTAHELTANSASRKSCRLQMDLTEQLPLRSCHQSTIFEGPAVNGLACNVLHIKFPNQSQLPNVIQTWKGVLFVDLAASRPPQTALGNSLGSLSFPTIKCHSRTWDRDDQNATKCKIHAGRW